MMIASRPPSSADPRPDVDIAAGEIERRLFLSHMMDERAAAAFAFGNHDLDAEPVEEADRRRVDLRVQHRLGATAQQRHPLLARALGRMRRGRVDHLVRGDMIRRELQHGRERPQRLDPVEEPREGPADAGERKAGAESPGIGQRHRQDAADHPVGEGPPVGPLDMRPRMVDEMHVVDARGAGGHAGEAGEAAVDMGDGVVVGRPVVLQHLLDQIDAPARAIELVAERDIGRAGRRAEAAMHAFADDPFAMGGVRIGKLVGGEGGLHR